MASRMKISISRIFPASGKLLDTLFWSIDNIDQNNAENSHNLL